MEDKKNFLKDLENESKIISETFAAENKDNAETINFENTIDMKKINNIKRMERLIVSDDFSPKKIVNQKIDNSHIQKNNTNVNSYNNSAETFSNNLISDLGNRDQKLIKHANFYHNFSEYGVNVLDIIPLYFKKEQFALENGIENNR